MLAPECVLSLGGRGCPAQPGPWGGEGTVHQPLLLLPAPEPLSAALRPSAVIVRCAAFIRTFQCCTTNVLCLLVFC